jgi:putative DNA primase/helicase
MYDNGYNSLISVSPPAAQLTPTSRIPAPALGKAPARLLPNGLYAGYDWTAYTATPQDVDRWYTEGSNIGLRADRFPALDIDCLDDRLAERIQRLALTELGSAPIRVGRFPKRLLMYRTETPIARKQLYIKSGSATHLVEMLGAGRQFLVHGIHPFQNRRYEWLTDVPPAAELTLVSNSQVDDFFSRLEQELSTSAEYQIAAGTRGTSRVATRDQRYLLAPTMAALTEAVQCIPNTTELFPSRDDYMRVGFAIRAACGTHVEEGLEIFSSWAAKWDVEGGNTPELVRTNWESMSPPFSIGWDWLADYAKQFGFNAAAFDFDADPAAEPQKDKNFEATRHSDMWISNRVVLATTEMIRFVPEMGRWLFWSGFRWEPDLTLNAEDRINQELKHIANEILSQGATDKERRKAEKNARAICSAHKSTAIQRLVRSDRRTAVELAALDADPWTLTTPTGSVALRTGEVLATLPSQLTTKSTAVGPQFGVVAPRWLKFLSETTGGDHELIKYLQRLCGYALTGATSEQSLVFIYGPGGNGKSVFLNTVSGILRDYAKVADMGTFTASHNDKHTTDIAMLAGARLVTASETQAGKRWDEQKIKSLTGGDAITARFMRQDNFTYVPQFKLIFVGNHKPELRDVDPAIRRRIHIVPFTITPENIDNELASNLREEWPAILAWMIEGCLHWQSSGLSAPAVVLASTADYFAEQDGVAQWLEEECELGGDQFTEDGELFGRFREWTNERSESPGSQRYLVESLKNRSFRRGKHSRTRRSGFYGIALRPRSITGLGGVL